MAQNAQAPTEDTAALQIREATDDDWPRIWPFFREIVDAGETYAYPEGMTIGSARPWWIEGPPSRTVVAEHAGTVVGTAKMGPNRPGRGAHVATASFMVDPAFRGHGVGRALGEYVVGAMRAAGYRSIQFNAVVETNEAAVRLWRSLGFRIVGTVPEAFDHRGRGLVGMHVMHLKL
jgi:L-amino acid N-acyltransferase YncA